MLNAEQPALIHIRKRSVGDFKSPVFLCKAYCYTLLCSWSHKQILFVLVLPFRSFYWASHQGTTVPFTLVRWMFLGAVLARSLLMFALYTKYY